MQRQKVRLAMRDNWIEVIRDAEAAFWKAIADGTPEATSGDLAPDVSATFTKACEDAAISWYQANVPTFDVAAFAHDLEALQPYKGWKAAWEFPGYLTFSNAEIPHIEVHCTPDHEGVPGIAFDVVDSRTGLSHFDVVAQVLPWPLEGRTVESFMDIMWPQLDRWTPILTPAPTVQSCGIRVLMRPPRKLERGWFVWARNAEEALVEIVRLSSGANPIRSAEFGWVADRDYTDEPNEDGLHAVTVVKC